MTHIKLATWNINSVRLRMPLLKKLCDEHNLDVVCLQETKVQDSEFPLEDIKALGFDHVVFRGEKSYNGVAILSRLPLSNVAKQDMANVSESRHISACLPDGTEIHNLYIPAGGDEPDIQVNPKFKFKLECLDYLTDWFGANKIPSDKVIAVGDFNIAPYEHDVWSHKQLLKVVSHTPIEVEKLLRFKESISWVDLARHFVPETEKLYSWWSYRNRDWRKSNRGRRLDHIWATSTITERFGQHQILNDVRDWERPSDHVPVIVSYQLHK